MSNNKREWADDEVTINLLQLYEEHEFLWKVKHTLYRNHEKRMSMFDEFATKFNNRDGAEVHWKIHNLRCLRLQTTVYLSRS